MLEIDPWIPTPAWYTPISLAASHLPSDYLNANPAMSTQPTWLLKNAALLSKVQDVVIKWYPDTSDP